MRRPGRLGRISHPGRLVGFTVFVLACVVTAFVAGTIVKAPTHDALENADASVAVTAEVETRSIGVGFTLPAKVNPAPETDLIITEASVQSPSTAPSAPPTAAPETPQSPAASQDDSAAVDRVVVSAMFVAPGDSLTLGQRVAEVSGRPIFAWPADVPLYRDIVSGDKGADVLGIQKTLTALGLYDGAVDGEYGSGTQRALAAMYTAAGASMPYVQPGVQGFAWREFLAIPAADAQVVSVAATGALLDADHAIVRVRSALPTLSVSATTLELDQLSVGSEVGVVVNGAAAVRSTVASVGAFVTDEETGASGYPVVLSIPEGATVDAQSTVVVQPWAQPEPSAAIPAIALRQEGGTTYVLARAGSGKGDTADEFTRVDVIVTGQNDGWVSIEETAEMTVGQEILVSDGKR